MFPASSSSRSWPSASSMENVHVFDSKPHHLFDQFNSCPARLSSAPEKADAGTQTDFDMRQQRCNRVTLAPRSTKPRLGSSTRLVREHQLRSRAPSVVGRHRIRLCSFHRLLPSSRLALNCANSLARFV
ncbi:hypothetical protein M3Y97_00121100 [Aphelenchoides bicaudatus]|nr:hypothetical protein M3Y97_00121100 [Aphelenchoides bicaudatus]